jgi:Sec-independent protein translocase protein TatA
MFALLDNLGTPEILLCAVAALLVFGRRLPEVAAQAGATLSKFRKGLDDAIHESGVEKEIQKIKQALPTDMSMRDVARAATRKVEDRMRELGAEADKIEKEVADSLKPPSEIAPTELTPAPPPTKPRDDGIDPAKNFGPPGSVPRE